KISEIKSKSFTHFDIGHFMKISRFLNFVPGLLFLAACSSTSSRKEASLPATNSKKVSIVMTSSRFLEIEPCGCSIAPLGGVEREWTAMQKAKASAEGGQVLNFTAGTTFVPVEKSFDVKKKDFYVRKAAYLMEAMNAL